MKTLTTKNLYCIAGLIPIVTLVSIIFWILAVDLFNAKNPNEIVILRLSYYLTNIALACNTITGIAAGIVILKDPTSEKNPAYKNCMISTMLPPIGVCLLLFILTTFEKQEPPKDKILTQANNQL